MKVELAVPLYSIIVLLCTCFPLTRCQTPVNCKWGPYGEWSECDGCSQTKVRTRQAQHAQYNGTPCQGATTESVPCVAEKACPLDTGCGERFRCTSGLCISPSLLCNGDQDCEDGLDEKSCDVDTSHHVCDLDKTPPNSAVTGRGYDVLTGKLKLGVIDTLRFGGQCRKVFSGDHGVFYRLPQSILRYSFEVQVNNEESDETYDSSWSYVQHVQSNAMFIHDRRTFHKELSETKAHKLLILKNQVQLAQFQNSAPQYLPLSEGFWKALAALPLTYDLSAYRRLLQTYGTHYMSEGSLGGEYHALLEFDQNAMQQSSTTDTEYKRCWRKVKRRLFYKKVKTTCEKLTQALKSSSGHDSNHRSVKTTTIGGDPAFSVGALNVLDLENPQANRDSYEMWASSVKDFPDVINQKLRPVYELVKEVPCAGLKKMHLKRALEELLAEEHPCHCAPCHNNGQPLLTGTQCSCVCRPGTSGLACERGTVAGEPQGVVHGSWSCWSSWSSCSRGQRSRSRSCSNPAPSRGGQSCIGLENETSPCEHPDVQYLQMMEPQCFGLSVAPQKTCGTPPALRNGFVVNPQDIYLVGNIIEYRCIDGHFLSGDAVSECTDNQQWTTGQMVCKSATCGPPPLSGGDVTFTPTKAAYQIGDRVTLSCPAGAALRGHVAESMCNPSLQWSPSLEEARCIEVPNVAATPPPPALNCKPWQTAGDTQCLCKMPFQCEPSLKLCASLGSRTRLLGFCQLGALQCVGRSFTLAKDAECDWPKETFTSCQHCNPGEKCNESATDCVCRDPTECPQDSTQMCVTLADGSDAVTMTECELGARRCAGEQVTVVGLEACQT